MCVYNSVSSLVLRVTEASQRFPSESLEAAADCLPVYRYDFSRQEQALRSINFHRGDINNFSCLHLENVHVDDKLLLSLLCCGGCDDAFLLS